MKKIVLKPNMTAGKSLQSDAVFAGIKDRVSENEAKAKAINAVFLYKITDGGKVSKEWGKYRRDEVVCANNGQSTIRELSYLFYALR